MRLVEASFPVPTITVGDRLRRLRLDTGLTQDRFGQRIGLSGATIAKYEIAETAPARGVVLHRLLKLEFGAAVADWVLGRDSGPDLRTLDYKSATRGLWTVAA